ncbi:hypothetical protein A2U01_0001558 [Trifolium medium]|uniref:Uncharacterized protein n=1 Tax=Trifolium medium TaxID=97028 RepID=A0A392M2E6_9FABA|nr:hypothetical protein [Trifolium medium]
MLSVEKRRGPSVGRKSDRPVLGFSDEERVGESPNEIVPLIIVTTIANHDISKILKDGGSSRDIMYGELFEKLGLKRDSLAPYRSTDL